jgi:molybdopterin-guanine dinucleotide biosynthesis protein A
MGTAKAALAWAEGTLLGHAVGVLAEATNGPVVVVRAAGQPLPPLPGWVTVVADPRPGLGPVQGIAVGLAALSALAAPPLAEPPDAAFVAATDLPFLHPAFVRRVLDILRADRADVALPVALGHAQPLAAAYRVALAPLADALVAAGRLRPADLFAAPSVRVTRPDAARLLAAADLAAADPMLDSLVNVNEPAEYAAAVGRAAAARGGSRRTGGPEG